MKISRLFAFPSVLLSLCFVCLLTTVTIQAAEDGGGGIPKITLTLPPDGNNNPYQEQETQPLKITIREYDDTGNDDEPLHQQAQPTIRIQNYPHETEVEKTPSTDPEQQGIFGKIWNFGKDKKNTHPPEHSGPYQSGPYEISGVTVVDIHTGRVMPIHSVDLKPTIDRIAAGIKNQHQNDGSVFRNLSHKLPRKSRNYYREYVVPTKGIHGPGPQRLIIGERGEMYYTSDHYETFVTVEKDQSDVSIL